MTCFYEGEGGARKQPNVEMVVEIKKEEPIQEGRSTQTNPTMKLFESFLPEMEAKRNTPIVTLSPRRFVEGTTLKKHPQSLVPSQHYTPVVKKWNQLLLLTFLLCKQHNLKGK
jgi:hypothetical protein